MRSLIIRIARRVVSLFVPNSVCYENSILPAKHIRFGGKEFWDNRYFLTSAKEETGRLVKHFGLTTNSSVLDVGCGVGRLPIGILNLVGEIRYYQGVDVHNLSIQWCRRYITRPHPSFKFTHIAVKNPRYNPNGKAIDTDFQLPLNDQEFDIIYLYSVFSHMTKEDIIIYLREYQRLLAPSGKIFLTAFIEKGVEDMTINPQDYGTVKWRGPLHCVRYNKDFFETLLTETGFCVDHFDYGKETNGQSALYISKTKKDIIYH